MPDYTHYFADFGDKIWLNAASEGPLPLKSAQELKEAVEWKSKPYLLDFLKFSRVPLELKKNIGRLLNVDYQDVILGNSASYGLHILANGIPWKNDDEVILMQNDFPTNILPWLALKKQGVNVRQLSAQGHVLTAQEIERNITPRTRVVCLSHVHTFSGTTLDVKKIGDICRNRKIIFVINISQSAGTMPLDFKEIKADAVVCAGYKWLCGPYGTGFCWIEPDLRMSLELNQAYWISSLSDVELGSEDILEYKEIKSARKYDVFGTANFFNFVPFNESINLFYNLGVDKVRTYHDELIDAFIKDLDMDRYDLISPFERKNRSSLIVIKHKSIPSHQLFEDLVKKNIFTAVWKGKLRLSPHVYNTKKQMQLVADILNRY